MWLYIPTTSRSSTQRRARACSRQQLSLLAPRSECVPEPSAIVSGTPVPRPVSWRGWKARPYLKLLSGTTLGHWTASRGAAKWIASVRAIRANRSRPPENNLGTAILATFGRPCVERLRGLNPASCSWRTWKDTLEKEPAKCFGISRGLAIALRRDCSRRLNAARATKGSGCLSSRRDWRTPKERDYHKEGKHINGQQDQIGLPVQAESWPTPVQRDAKVGDIPNRVGTPSLSGTIEAWPSPRAEDSQNCGNHPEATDSLTGAIATWATPTSTASNRGPRKKSQKGGRLLERDVAQWATPNTARRGSGQYRKKASAGGDKDLQREVETDKWPCLATPLLATTGPLGLLLQAWTPPECPRLNPAFVSWLMGWPPGLTSFDLSATAWTHWWRHTLSCLCGLVSGSDA